MVYLEFSLGLHPPLLLGLPPRMVEMLKLHMETGGYKLIVCACYRVDVLITYLHCQLK